MSGLTRDGTAEPVSRDQILRRERGQRNIQFPCSIDHVQDWQPYPVDPYSCYMCDHTGRVWSVVVSSIRFFYFAISDADGILYFFYRSLSVEKKLAENENKHQQEQRLHVHIDFLT